MLFQFSKQIELLVDYLQFICFLCVEDSVLYNVTYDMLKKEEKDIPLHL